MKTIVYSKRAVSFLKKLVKTDAQRIRDKIKQYAQNPEEMANQVKKLQGVPFYRLRVGDYRVIFNEDGIILNIINIGNRGDIYKELKR